jgi:hypothetical protein
MRGHKILRRFAGLNRVGFEGGPDSPSGRRVRA